MTPFIFVIIGLLLILVEFYIPGAVMGILGGVSILIGILLFISQASSLWTTILFILGVTVAIGIVIRFALWRIVKTKPQYSIYSDDNQSGYLASTYDQNAIGKQGIVITDLKPGGYILVEGKQQPAISISGYIAKGQYVVVIGGQEQSLMVNLIEKDEK